MQRVSRSLETQALFPVKREDIGTRVRSRATGHLRRPGWAYQSDAEPLEGTNLMPVVGETKVLPEPWLRPKRKLRPSSISPKTLFL